MANFFTRALDVVTPWNRGGEVQRRQQAKKKKDEEAAQRRQSAAPTTQVGRNNVSQPQIKPQRPENLFQGLNDNLKLPTAPKNNTQVNPNTDLTPLKNPNPGTVIKPTQPVQPAKPKPRPAPLVVAKPKQGFWNKVRDQFDANTEADKYRRQDRTPTQDTFQANAAIAARSAGSIGSNVAGGLIGVGKGIVELPSAALSVPKLIRLGAAKATGNKKAEENIANDKGVLTKLSQGYERLVNPVTKRLTGAELSTDRAAKSLAPWAPNYVKNTTKVLTNLIPVEAAVAGAVGLSKASKARKLAKETEVAAGGTGTAGITSRATTNEISKLLSDAQLEELTRPPVQIPITQTGGGNTPIPVGIPRPGAPIREIGGDTPGQVRIPTPSEVAAQRAVDQFKSQAPGRPDSSIEGVIPRPNAPVQTSDLAIKTNQSDLVDQYAKFLKDVGEGNGVNITADGKRVSNNVRFGDTKGRRMTKAAWREEAEKQLRSGKADPSIQKAFDDAADPEVQSLLAKGDRTEEPPVGRPITVKEARGIPVRDETVVPQGLPETPGTVRATVQTSPMAAKSEAVANTPTAVTPPAIPAEVQYVLDNQSQFTKRQVAAARNQRKLAKQLAKTKADTQAVIDGSPQLAPKPEGNPGFVPTGEFRRGENGNISEVARGDAEAAQAAADTANLSSGDVLAKANQDIAQNGLVSPESVRNLQGMLDSGRFPQTSPEYRAIAKTLYGAGSDYGRGLSLFNPTLRRTASGEQLANRFISKLYGVAEDGNRFTDAHFNQVQQADSAFANARDAANQALDRYNATKSAADFNAWKQARQVADDAEKHSLITEYRVANDVLKGNKNPEAVKAIQKAEQDAGVYQMDWIDASMLSGTGTFVRNFVNTSLVRMENRLFGGRGYSSKGAKIGNKIGNRSVVSDVKARNELDQNKLSKVVKQWATTGNTLGEGNIKAVGSARAYKYYEKQLKSQGITGDRLKMDTEAMLHTDPDGMAKHYEDWALSENALSSMAHNSKKLEQTLVDAIAAKHGKLAQVSAKALVRLTVGFPTVIGRSLYGGAKRATLGLPDLGVAGKAFAKGDSQAMADALYSAKVHAGSGASLYALGTGLASAGIISPSYPSDPAERARWKAEGIQPNSIKIAGQWFSIPGYFGALALPLVIPANVMNKTNPADIAKGVIDGINDLAPTTGIVNFVNGMEGRAGSQWVKNEVASLTRAVTPLGSLLNQIASMTDSTKNDTSTKDAIHNILDAIAGGVPGVNNIVNKTPATDDNGNILHNPNPIARALGAQGSEQPQGKQDNQQAQAAANDSYKQLTDYGVTKDKSLMALVDPKIAAQIKRGEKLSPEDLAKVQKSITKGVTATGEDTVYLEKGQYDTNLAALKVKKKLLEDDPTTKPSDLAQMDVSIKRGQLYKDNKIPFEAVTEYKGTTLSDWRKMGDPESDEYDPETYQRLWDIDQLMTKAGVSYAKGKLDKNKYSAKTSGSGSGGRGGKGSKQTDFSFGTLKAGTGAPRVQQYDTIATKSGGIPHISVVRPNIVHKISSS